MECNIQVKERKDLTFGDLEVGQLFTNMAADFIGIKTSASSVFGEENVVIVIASGDHNSIPAGNKSYFPNHPPVILIVEINAIAAK